MRRLPMDTLGAAELAGWVRGGAFWDCRRFRPGLLGAGALVPKLEKFHLPPLPRTRRNSGSRRVMELTSSERESKSGNMVTPTSSDLAVRNGALPKAGS